MFASAPDMRGAFCFSGSAEALEAVRVRSAAQSATLVVQDRVDQPD
jgi:hypothetical protein